MYFLVVFFYEQNTAPSNAGVAYYAISAYERVAGYANLQHVGVSLAFVDSQHQCHILPYDVSAWAGRYPGPSRLALYPFDTEAGRIMVSKMFMLPLRGDLVHALFTGFHGTPFTQPTVPYAISTQSPYPGIGNLIVDFLAYQCGLVGRSDPYLDALFADLATGRLPMQCAQLTLLFLLNYVCTDQAGTLGGHTAYALRQLARRGTALHPAQLYDVLHDAAAQNILATGLVERDATAQMVVMDGALGAACHIAMQSPGDVAYAFASDFAVMAGPDVGPLPCV